MGLLDMLIQQFYGLLELDDLALDFVEEIMKIVRIQLFLVVHQVLEDVIIGIHLVLQYLLRGLYHT